MKTLIKILKISLIAVVAGIILLIFGIIDEILALTIAGGCLIGAYVVLASVTYVCAMVDSVKKKEENNGGSKKATEEEMVEEINSSVGISNESAVHARQFATAFHSMRNMGALDKFIVSILLIICICGTAAVIALIATGYQIAGICTACGLIVFVGGVIVITQTAAKSKLKNSEADETQPPVFGKVISCVNYCETTFTTGNNNAYQSTQKTRIKSTVYKVRVSITQSDDGEEISKSGTAKKTVYVFSKTCYDSGDEVKLARRKGSKKSYIIVD